MLTPVGSNNQGQGPTPTTTRRGNNQPLDFHSINPDVQRNTSRHVLEMVRSTGGDIGATSPFVQPFKGALADGVRRNHITRADYNKALDHYVRAQLPNALDGIRQGMSPNEPDTKGVLAYALQHKLLTRPQLQSALNERAGLLRNNLKDIREHLRHPR